MNNRFFQLDNGNGLKGTFSSFGAGVRSLTLRGRPLILTIKDDEVYFSQNQFYGKTLGRVAGRVPDEVLIDGKYYSLPGDGQHICLHAGYTSSLSFKEFKGEEFENDEEKGIVFTYLSKDGENGFPGNLLVHVYYSFLKNGKNDFRIRLNAVSDKDTLVSLSNHRYWLFPDSKDVSSYHLQVKANRIGRFRKGTELVVGREEIPSYLDFNDNPNLGKKLDERKKEIPEIGTLDHTYLLKEGEERIVVEDEHYRLKVDTDFEAVNFYVDTSRTPIDFSNSDELRTKDRRGIAIEPETFPLRSNLVLVKGKLYSHEMVYHIEEK